jgi:hypothetical protein
MSSYRDTVVRYFDGFSRSDHEQILDLLTDDVIWHLPGQAHVEGKVAFDAEIENPRSKAARPCASIASSSRQARSWPWARDTELSRVAVASGSPSAPC